MSIHGLPTELLAAILGNLDGLTALTCRRVNKAWNQVARSDAVLRSICQNMGYLKPGQTLEQLRTLRPQVPDSPLSFAHFHSQAELDGRQASDLESYETFYRTSRRLQSAWPDAPPRSKPAKATKKEWLAPALVRTYDGNFGPRRPYAVWRVKYDPVEDCFIHTRSNGPGLGVTDARTGELLFFYRKVRPCAHLEYSEGWAVHDTLGRDHFHIWRFERLAEDVLSPRRGILRRYGSLRCPYDVRAYRMHYPYLAVATANKRIVVYNVPEKVIIQDFAMYSAAESARAASSNIIYIEFDTEFFFVLDKARVASEKLDFLQIYSRRDGSRVCSLSKAQLGSKARSYCLDTAMPYESHASFEGGAEWRQRSATRGGKTSEAEDAVDEAVRRNTGLSAVHHDAATGALMLLGWQGLFVIENYAALCKKPSDDGGQELHVSAMFLAWEDSFDQLKTLAVADGRFACTCDSGLLLGDIRSVLATLQAETCTLPHHTLWHYADFALDFSQCSSLHMSSTSVTGACQLGDMLLTYKPTIASTREIEEAPLAGEHNENEEEVVAARWQQHLQDFSDDEDNQDDPVLRFAMFDFGHISRNKLPHDFGRRWSSATQIPMGTIVCYPGAKTLSDLIISGEARFPEDEAPVVEEGVVERGMVEREGE